MNYDPENAPDAALWLAASDAERQQAVRAAYDLLGEGFDSEEEAQRVCSTQALVETQVAQARPPAVAQTLARLIGEGMTRADALHFMVGAALPHQVLAEGQLEGAEYEADLAQLSQETFQTMMEGEGSKFVPEDALYLFCVGPIATEEGTLGNRAALARWRGKRGRRTLPPSATIRPQNRGRSWTRITTR